ncbi:MAG: ABC transporter substrate-binding protein [Candidatus Rokubacteria bacterium]|nr:ABC transporter substrate-binding protein [Candidatus Rokubacteria bacterium]
MAAANRRTRSVFAVGVVLGLIAAAAAPSPAQSRTESREVPSDGGTYRRPLGNDPGTLDPARIGDIYGRSVAQQIFDGLVQFDHTLAIVPALAKFWKASRDGLTWTFTLKPGLKFHHGREVTADDVVYSLTRLLDPRVKSSAADVFSVVRGAAEFRAGRARQVSGFTALDRHTVQIVLSESLGPFVPVLAIGHAKIVPRDVAEAAGDAFGTRPVGTGPFRFVRWDRGKEIVLAANPDYFDGPPRLGRIVYRIFPGEQLDAMYEEFQRGRLDDTPLPNRDYRRIIADPRHVHLKRPTISLRFYGFNTRRKPFDDPRVRQAVNHAIDRSAIIDDAFLGRYALARGILPPGTLGFNPRVNGYAYDPQRSRDLLARAGYPGGRGLPSIAIWSSVKHEGIVREHELMARQLEAVGIEAEFHYLTEWPAFFKRLLDGEFPMFVLAWFADVPDPDNFLSKLFHSESPRNFTRYTNPAVDRLLNGARSDRQVEKRVELYRRAEQMILDDAAILPVWHYTYERLFQPYVRSVEVSGLGDPYIPLRKVWLAPAR